MMSTVFSVGWSTQLAGPSETPQKTTWEPCVPGLIMVRGPCSCLTVCSFIFFIWNYSCGAHKAHIFSFKLSDFLTRWGISLSVQLDESSGITGGHIEVMGNSSALLALPWQSRRSHAGSLLWVDLAPWGVCSNWLLVGASAKDKENASGQFISVFKGQPWCYWDTDTV